MGKTTDKLAELREREKALPEDADPELVEKISRDLEMVENLCHYRKFRSCDLWLHNAELCIKILEAE